MRSFLPASLAAIVLLCAPALSSAQIITVAPSIVTTSLGGNDNKVTLGELVNYSLLVTMPEVVTPALAIRFVVPAGMAYVPGSSVLGTAGFNGTVALASATPVTAANFNNGTDVAFGFTPITTAPDNVAGNNSFTLAFQAVVLDVASNVGVLPIQTLLDSSVQHNGGTGTVFGTAAPAPTLTVTEPYLVALSSVVVNGSGTVGDAASPATFTVVVRNSIGGTPSISAQSAYDIGLNETFPAGFTPAGFTVTHTSLGDVSASFALIGAALQTNAANLTLAPGDAFTATVNGGIDASVNPSTTYTATSTVGYSGYPGNRSPPAFDVSSDVSTDRERVYSATGSASFGVPAAMLAKSLFTTSAAHTTGANVSIGELAVFQLAVTLPEGTTPSLQLIDLLPPGLQYVSAIVDTSGFAGSLPTPTMTGGAGNGDDVTFTFGSISVVGDNISSNDTFRVRVTARVLDVPGNVNGVVLANTASLSIGAAASITTPAVSVAVVVPQLALAAAFDAGARDAGNPLTLTFDLSNTGSTTAFDSTVRLVLDPNIDLATLAFPQTPSGWNRTLDVGTRELVYTDTDANGVAPGALRTFALVATVAADARPGATIAQTIAVTGTTQPGVDAGERTLAPQTGSASLVLASTLGFAKTRIASTDPFTTGSDASFGETLTYRLATTLQQGVTARARVQDVLPAALELRPFSVFFRGVSAVGMASGIAYADGSMIAASDITLAGNTLSVALRDIAIPADAGTGDGQFAIDYGAVLLQLPFNNGGDVFTNSASVAADRNGDGDSVDAGETSAPGSVQGRVVEPELAFTNAFDVTTADAGNAVRTTIVLTNTGTGNGFETSAKIQFTPGQFVPSTLAITAPPGWQATYNASTGLLLFQDNGGQGFAPGASATLQASGVLSDQLAPGITVATTGSATTTSAQGAQTYERVSAPLAANASISVPSTLAFAKTLLATDNTGTSGSSVAIGETATFRLAATLQEGRTSVLSLRDAVPAGLGAPSNLVFRAPAPGATATGASSGVTYVDGSSILAADRAFAGGALQVSLRDVQIPATPLSGSGQVAVDYAAQVEDVAANNSGTTLTNTAFALADRTADGDTVDAGEASANGAVTLTVALPQLGIDKRFDRATAAAGDTLRVTLLVDNSGAAAAFDSRVTDVLDTTFDRATFTPVGTPAGWTVDYDAASGTLHYLRAAAFAPGASATFTFDVDVSATLPVVAGVSNTASIDGSTAPGTTAGERTLAPVSDTATAGAAAPLAFAKTLLASSALASAGSDMLIGERATFRLAVTLPSGSTPLLQIDDSLPAGIAVEAGRAVFRSASGVTAVGAVSGTAYANGATLAAADATRIGDMLQVRLRDVAVPANGSGAGDLAIDYDAIVADLPATVDGTVLATSALAAVDANDDGDTDDAGETSAPATVALTARAPVLTLAKAFDVATAAAGYRVGVTLTLTNTGAGPAFESRVTDVLGTAFDRASLDNLVLPPGWTSTYDAGTGTLQIVDATGAGIGGGGARTLTFDIALAATLAPGSSVTNTASAVASTLPGADTNERTLAPVDATATLVTPASLALAKTLQSTSDTATGGSDVRIGEAAVFRLALELQPGATARMTFDDVLPAPALVYRDGSATLRASGGATAVGAISATVYGDGSAISTADVASDAATGSLRVALVNVVIPSTNAAIALDYTVDVIAVPGNTTGATFTNTATASADLDADGNIDATEETSAPSSHTLTLREQLDFGDAPAPYPTRLADDGARHTVLVAANPTLGASVDADADGAPSAALDGDDTSVLDDEDGVRFDAPLIAGLDAGITLQAGTTGGIVSCWLDANRDGDWNDAGEGIVTDLALAANASSTQTFALSPQTAAGAAPVRCRIASVAGLGVTGAAPDGEVEDHVATVVVARPAIGAAKAVVDVVTVQGTTSDVTFRLLVENTGDVALTAVQLRDDLATQLAAADSVVVTNVQSATLPLNAAFDGRSDTALLAPGATLAVGARGTVLLTVRIDSGGNPGPYANQAEATAFAPDGATVFDLSNSGATTDPDGDGSPANNDVSTAFTLAGQALPELPPTIVPALDPRVLALLALLLGLVALVPLRRGGV